MKSQQFDVFLSHNSVDKPWVIKLKEDLHRYGVSVWLDKDEIRPGDLFGRALEEGLESSRAVALIVSPEAMASGWVEEEYYRALSLTKDKGAPLQLVPVILRDAEIPGFVKSRNWVDFRNENTYADNVWKLVWGITGEKPPQILDLNTPDLPLPKTKPNRRSFLTRRSLIGLGVVAFLAILIIGSILFWNLNPTETGIDPTAPATMTGSFRVAVPGFVEQNGNASDKGTDLAQEVADRLQNRFDEMSGHPSVTVWGPDQAGSIASQTHDEIANSARQLAQDIEADVVVYGVIDSTKNTVTPKFELGTDRFKDFDEVEEIISEQAIGAPLPTSAEGDFIDRETTGRKLAVAVEILSNILYGLGYYYSIDPDYQRALTRFQAADIKDWPDDQGKHVLYVLLGNAAGKTGNYELAEEYYKKSKSIEPKYANAYVGLANVYYITAIAEFQETSDPTDIVPVLLDQAIDMYNQAKQVARHSPSPNLATKVHFGLGECYIFKSLVSDSDTVKLYYDKALEEFNAVILDYAGGDRPRLKGLAGESHARLGLMYKISDKNCALKEYSKALDLLEETSENYAKYEHEVEELISRQADATECVQNY